MSYITHLSCIAVPQVQRGHEVGVIFLNTCWPLCELIGLWGHINSNDCIQLHSALCIMLSHFCMPLYVCVYLVFYIYTH